MKLHIFLSTVVCTLVFSSLAQQNALYLIVTEDHLFQGARDEREDTIIAVEYHYSGELLYHPLLFDNGPDYVHEGLRRFVNVKSGKVGYVRPDGEVVIPAQYDFLTPIENGYTTAYNGVKRLTAPGEEHGLITPATQEGISSVVLNRDNEIVRGTKTKSDSYSVYNSEDLLYYPLYYVANDKEKAMLANLTKSAAVKAFLALDHQTLALNIFERPREGFPYYVVGEVKSWKDYLLVGDNGDIFYFDYLSSPVLLTEYLRQRKVAPVE